MMKRTATYVSASVKDRWAATGALLFAIAYVFAPPSAAYAEVVELVDGSRFDTEYITFSNGNFITDDGRVIPRAEIKRILFVRGSTPRDTVSGLGRSDVTELLRHAEEAEKKHPDVGAITLIDDGEYILREDGTHVERSHYAVKILKEAWKSFAEIGNSFEEGRSRVTLVRARTIGPDGSVYEFDPADLKEAKPMEGMVSFSEHKVVSGQLPDVQVGSIVEVIWDREMYNPYDKELFYPGWFFAATDPVVWSRVTIRIPKSRTLYYKTANMPDNVAEPVITVKDNQRVYQWEMRDIEHIVPEPVMPPIGQVAPRLTASLHENWDYLYDFLAPFQKEHIKLTPAIEDKVTEIVGDAATSEQKLARIYHWLQREIRYISIKGSMGSGWSGHPAGLTLENGYGDCIDKAILFSTMLEAVNIEAYPVIIATNDLPADDRSLPRLFANHAINKIRLLDRTFYLDTTAETFRYPFFRPDDHGVATINVLEREIGVVGVPPPDHNAMDIRLDMAVDMKGNVNADVTMNMTGGIEAGLRMALEQINRMMLKMVAQQAINSVSPGAKLEQIDISDEADLTVPLTVKMKVSLPEYPTFAGELMIFPLPLSEGLHQYEEASLDERRFDIDYGTSEEIQQHVGLRLPPGYEAKGLPESLSLKSPYVDYQANFSEDGMTIVFEERFSRARRTVPKEDYLEYKASLERIADYARRPVFLKKVREDPT
ncbi:MAG: DUF3857 domain-containing protein [Phycisphaerales bacterium]|nr:MAG: DUF3857 domain-containing protein [Phycisphaerales bacterium]